MAEYDAVVFDAGDTLLHPSPSFPHLLERFIAERGHNVGFERIIEAEAALARPIAALFDERRLWSTSTDNSREFWSALYRMFAAHLGIDDPGLPLHLYERFRMPEHYALFDDALPALRRLRGAGYKLGVLSNFEAWLEGLLVSLEVMPFIDALVVSGVEGIEKPDPKIFELALGRIGSSPERTVYVGDSPDFDIRPATDLGMRAFLIDRRGRHDPDLWPVVTTLEQVADALL